AYDQITGLQLKLTTTLSSLTRELKMWTECIQDIRLMSETNMQVLLANKVFDDPKNNLTKQWVFNIDWKMKVLDEAIDELRNMLQKGEAFQACIISEFQDLHCQLHKENSEEKYTVQEIKEKFKTFVKEDLFRSDTISKEKMEEICALQTSIKEANKGFLDNAGFGKDMEDCLGSWTHLPTPLFLG
ncbi:hypothetical protein KI387_038259, partial [Taxus chinensis]